MIYYQFLFKKSSLFFNGAKFGAREKKTKGNVHKSYYAGRMMIFNFGCRYFFPFSFGGDIFSEKQQKYPNGLIKSIQ